MSFGLGHIGIAGSDEHIDGGNTFGPQRHGADGLDTAKAIDLIGAGKMLGGDDRRRELALIRRSTRRHAGDARHLRRNDRHVSGRQKRVFSTRHVTAGRLNRDILVAENDARQRFNLDVANRGPLMLREIADLCLRER